MTCYICDKPAAYNLSGASLQLFLCERHSLDVMQFIEEMRQKGEAAD